MLIEKTSNYDNVHIFQEDKETNLHRHLIDGVEVPSVTQLLTEQGIAPKYPEDNEKVRKAAEKGTQVHKEIEGTEPLLSNEAIWVKKEVEPKYDIVSKESLVHFKKVYAGIVDFIGVLSDANEIHIIDWKSGLIHKEVVMWQLTLYYYALVFMEIIPISQKVRIFAGDLKEDHCELIELELMPEEEFVKLINAHNEGKTYEKPFFALEVQNNTTSVEKSKIDTFLALWNEMPITVRYDIYKKMDKEAKVFTEEQIKKPLVDSGLNEGITPDGYKFVLSESSSSSVDYELWKKKAPKQFANFEKAKQKYTVTNKSVRLLYKGNVNEQKKGN